MHTHTHTHTHTQSCVDGVQRSLSSGDYEQVFEEGGGGREGGGEGGAMITLTLLVELALKIV